MNEHANSPVASDDFGTAAITLERDWIDRHPRVMDYRGIWCMEEGAFSMLYDMASGIDMAAHFAALAAAPARMESAPYQIVDGVAIIDISGPMMKFQTSLGEGASTVAIRRQLSQAARDRGVSAIALRIDSPGGTVAGTRDLAEAVAQANAAKPVTAYIEDIGASAAYWVASAAGRIHAGAAALVGSIGTYGVLYDVSQRFAQMGVRPIVIRAGEFKGAGTQGTAITPEQVADYQRTVNELNALFVGQVSASRRLTGDRLAAVTDGRLHVGEHAKALGLVDEISSFDAVVSGLRPRSIVAVPRATAPEPTHQEGEKMPDNQQDATAPAAPKPAAATIAEIKAACPGADSSFVLAQLEAGATIEAAKSAFIASLVEARNQPAPVAAAPVAPAPNRPGVPPIASAPVAGNQPSSDPIVAWNDAISAALPAHNGDRYAAAEWVARNNSELRAAYVDAVNRNRKPAARR